MSAPGVTPAVARAEAEIYSTIWGGPRDDDRFPDGDEYEGARAVLAAALTDADDHDALARTLYVLHFTTAPNRYSNREVRAWWSGLSEGTRAHWRAVADGLRNALLGADS